MGKLSLKGIGLCVLPSVLLLFTALLIAGCADLTGVMNKALQNICYYPEPDGTVIGENSTSPTTRFPITDPVIMVLSCVVEPAR